MNTKITDILRLKFGKLITYTIWAVIALLIFSIVQNAGKVIKTRAEIQKEREKVEKMKEVNAGLEQAIAEAQSTSFIEKQVRDKLGLAKAGESIVILPDENTLRKLAPQTLDEENLLPDPNWKKWEKLFF